LHDGFLALSSTLSSTAGGCVCFCLLLLLLLLLLLQPRAHAALAG
jgi:hypothetical protein